MQPFERLLLRLFALFRGLPPPGRMTFVLPMAFAGSWGLLNVIGLAESTAFVWAAVLAQATALWVNAPRMARAGQPRTPGRPDQRWHVMIFFLGLIGLQVWVGEPWVSHRLVSGYCALIILTFAIAILGNRDYLDAFAGVPDDMEVTITFRRSYLMLKVIIAMVVIAVNEGLLLHDVALSQRVLILSLMPVTLHYVSQVIARLTLPYE